MIKLPPLNITADADSGLTTATAATGEKGLSDGFLDLFSKALPGLVTSEGGETLSLSATLNKATGQDLNAQDAAAGKTTLADLLNKLDMDQPEALSALLANVGKATGADKSGQAVAAQETTHDLSTADMQALSALFAMLPQQNTSTPATTLTSTVSKDTDEASPLNALLASDGVQQKNTAGRADDSLSITGKTQTTAAKSVAPVANQVADDSTLPVIAVDKDSRDNAISNNTTPTVSTPTISSATVSTPVSTNIATPVAPQISAQLGSQEWQQAVSQHVTLFTRQGQQSAELRLHPEDLGQIQISLKLDDNQAQLQMTSPHSHVRAALEATLPALRTALAESGIQLGQSSISSESFAQQQQQSGQQQQQSQRSAGSFPSLGGEAESLAVPASVQRLASGNNAVDIFA
ncbi:flagellar hook-length control protein FliK [Cedecea colo]|uniref:Flagellar hook-length control protein FliK n=1 Tax=Cedecea colo TaxID=2552946 RepID=A0ABX0VQE0_9ENTR|nr:flagellar hook-length control protein FliK [Cedecea colo]NIY49317.1 flagellar hook-length control protein FliK [Cedecea colo]